MTKRDRPFRPGPKLTAAAPRANDTASSPELGRRENDAAALLLECLAQCGAIESAAVMFCGAGREVVALTRAFPNARVLGLDADERAICRARARAAGADVLERAVFARLDPLLGIHGPHQLVVLRRPLRHNRDAEGALRAAAGALVPTGLCAVLERRANGARVIALARRAGFVPIGRAHNPRSSAMIWLLARAAGEPMG
jgi:hypothetical protein